MTTLDWIILLCPWIVIFLIGRVTQSCVKSVSDFLTAGRAAGRYLVCVAEGMSGLGLISVVGACEMYYSSGMAITWWSSVTTCVTLALAISGFVIYRFRETRAMTMAQFLEIRYSRRFRIFMGLLAWFSGAINYGIFPAVAGRFFIYYCGLPQTLPILGLHISTYALLMAVFLALALYFVLLGGQLQIMVTDCVQGIMTNALFIVLIYGIFKLVTFRQIYESLAAAPAGQSMLNPFDTAGVEDFNIWFVLIGAFGTIYTYMAWQGSQGFNASALNAHEAKMGKVLAGWRGFAQTMCIVLLAIAAYTWMHHPDFSARAAEVNAGIGQIDNPQIQKQMTVSVVLSHFLPSGFKGVFAAIMMFLMVTTDTSYLHSWGTIFVQDVVLPIRNRPLSPKTHILALRLSIIGVAVFAFLFSLFFRQTDYILMFFAITGTIFVGGAGAAIIGGLYWKKGTTSAAWSAMITGSSLAVAGIVIKQIVPAFPLNGQAMYFIAMIAAIVVYVVVSLLTCRRDFDMDRLLHRGPYALQEDASATQDVKLHARNWKTILLGFDEHFTLGDKILSSSLFGWNMLLLGLFLIVTAICVIHPLSTEWWWGYTQVMLVLAIVINIVTTVWFSIGGTRDLFAMFRRLKAARRDVSDDGFVRKDPQILPNKQVTEDAAIAGERSR